MYTAEISRDNPSCILFLIDQSGSMGDPFAGQPGQSKAARLAIAVNRLLDELVIKCAKDMTEGARNYYDVGVIGYGQGVSPAFSGALAGRPLVKMREVADNPFNVETVTRKVEDGAGGLLNEDVKMPVWFTAKASGGTPMCEALTYAHSVLQPWVVSHPRSYPPMVINITDGDATDGDPTKAAATLRSLSTDDGDLILFNLHISSLSGNTIAYPDSDSGLPDRFAKQLFTMSSLLPERLRSEAQSEGYPVTANSRGFVFGANMVEVIKFLDIGTRNELR